MYKRIPVFLFECLMVAFIFIRTGLAQEQDIKQPPKGLLLEAPKIQHSTIFNRISSTIIFEETFESDVSGWSTSGSWQIGNPTSGPNGGYNSAKCAATNLSGNYSDNADDWLISPAITLYAPSSKSEFTLHFMEWFQLESGYDYGYVKISTDGGSTWTSLGSRSGSSDWRQHQINLTVYANQEIKLAFQLTSDFSVNYAGWYVDDIQITRDDPEPLSATLTSLNSQSFPFIFMNVAVDTFGIGFPGLTKSNFKVYENDLAQTEFFEVTPPEQGGGVRLTDIVFLMDNSGSMEEEINAVRNNMIAFVNNLSASGVDFALGLCRFGASENNGNPIIEDNGILTTDAEYFKNVVWARNVIVGGFEPGWDALYVSANGFNFRPGSQKIFVLITDEGVTGCYDFFGGPNQGQYSKEQTIQILQTKSIATFALIDSACAETIDDYGTIAEATNGAYFDIYRSFDAILNFISTQISNTYVITYRSRNPVFDGVTRTVLVEVTYQAFSDTAVGSYIPGAAPSIQRTAPTVALHEQPWAEGTTFNIEAEITDDIEPFVQSARLFYNPTTATTYSSVEMVQQQGNVYRGVIPGSDVVTPGMDYYITATDSVTTSSDPSTNPATNPYQLAILPNEAPAIEHTPVTTLTPGTEITITARIIDNTNSLASTKLYYRKTGQLLYEQTDMMATDNDNYGGVIPASFVTENGVEYYIHAVDDFGVGSYSGTPDEPHVIGASLPDLTPIREGGQWRAALSFERSETGEEWVRITATIRNDGDAPASNVEVEFYEGDPESGGTLIGKGTIAEVFADNSATVSVDWQAGSTGGNNGIFLKVDPQNLISEIDESNNIAEYYQTPVIIVPAIVGSPLYYSVDDELTLDEKVWLPDIPELNLVAPNPSWQHIFLAIRHLPDFDDILGQINGGLLSLTLDDNGQSEFSIKVGPGNFGTLVERLQLPLLVGYRDLIDALREKPYTLRNPILPVSRQDNIFLFLYDWRLTNDLSATRLGKLVKDVQQLTDSPKVHLICHSMGGLVAKAAITLGYVDRENIGQIIFLGTPHLGAPKFLYVLETGDFLPVLFADYVKNIVERAPAGYQLLPSDDYFSDEPELEGLYDSYLQKFNPFTAGLFLQKLDSEETKQHIIDNHHGNIFGGSREFIDKISNVDFGSIRVTNIVGYGLPTIGIVQNKGINIIWLSLTISNWEKIENLSGDGTVPLRSAERINKSTTEADYYLYQVKHDNLPGHFSTHLILENLLYWYRKNPPVFPPIFTSDQLPTDLHERYAFTLGDRIRLWLVKTAFAANAKSLSNVVSTQQNTSNILEIIDTQGRVIRLGTDYSLLVEIPGGDLQISTGFEDSTQITVILPAGDLYQVNHTVPEGKSTNGIAVSRTANPDGPMTLAFPLDNFNQGTNVQFELQPKMEQFEISVDFNGDAIYDSLIAPTQVTQEFEIVFQAAGWHMFSPAIDLTSIDVASIMQDISNGVAFHWNGSSYVQPDTFRMGRGYWLPVLEPTSPIFSGAPKDSITLHFMPGWHMIGPLSRTVDFIDPQDKPDGSILATFGWDASTQSYHPATSLKPGKGYWIAVAQECDLTIGDANSATTKTKQVKLEKAAFYKTFGQTPPPPPGVDLETDPSSETPIQYELYQNYPNPFNPATTIRYGLPERSYVKLEAYNTLGQRIRVLVEKSQEAGYHEVVWDGKDSSGRTVSSGIYFYQLRAGDLILVKKGLLLK